MKLRSKILGGYGLIIVVALFVGLWAIFNLYRLGRASDAILQENYRSILAAERMLAALERQDSIVLASLLGGEETSGAAFRDNELEFTQWLGRAQDNVTLAGEAEALAEIEAAYLDFLGQASELEPLPSSPGRSATAYYEALFPAFTRAREALVRLRDLNQEAMLSASERTQNVATQAIWSTSIIGLVALGTGIFFSFLLAQRLALPLQMMTAAAEQIAAGDYEVHVAHESADEVGQLASQINEMSEKLQRFHALNVGQLLAEKRRNEAILQSISDGIILVDETHKILTLNREAAQIFGTTPAQAQGVHLFDVVRVESLYNHVQEIIEQPDAPRPAEEQELEIVRGDGSHVYRYFCTPVAAASSSVLGVVVLLQDVTELKELDRLKSEFVMTVSHELRTPLTGIGMSIDLLREDLAGALSQRHSELLQMAHDDVVRLKALVNDLLDLSKIESGHISMSFDAVPVALLAEKAAMPFAVQAQEQEVTLINEMASSSLLVQADANKITWVLTNLIANALRYTSAGDTITLTARAGSGWAYLAVGDSGQGIPAEYQSKIFDKFVQVRGERSEGGSGLGLAISKEIVKAHGGVIWVDSTPGEGSTFTFTLPLSA